MSIRWFAGLSILSLSVLTAAGAAWACSCVRYANAQAQLEDTELMFVGRATHLAGESPGDSQPGITEFTVERTLKGEHRAVRRIAHGRTMGGMCGVQFQRGRTYVVLASAFGGRLSTSACQSAQFPLADYENALSQ